MFWSSGSVLKFGTRDGERAKGNPTGFLYFNVFSFTVLKSMYIYVKVQNYQQAIVN